MSSIVNDNLSEHFTGIRKIVWPVHNHEIKKVASLALMMFFVLFNYTILRDAKDGLIVTAPGSGAELISFLKLYGTLTGAVLIMAFYSKLSLIISRQNLFYTMITVFLIFFISFGYILYPLKYYLHASPVTIKALQAEYPRLYWFIPLFGNWTYSLFYIMSELWGSVALSVLFWQFANDITSVKESKRFYPLFGIIGNLGVILSGYILFYITSKYAHLDAVSRWDLSLHFIVNLLAVNMIVIMFIYNWIRKNVLTDPLLYMPEASKSASKSSKPKVKLSFKESIKVVFNSKYISLIMMIIICYGVCINLVEVTWKSQMKLQYPSTAEYVKMMGLFSMSSGLITIVLMIVGSNILRRFGWFVSAIITPVMLLVTGCLFFSFIIFKDSTAGMLSMLNMTPLLMAVMIGWGQNILTKGSKYSMFDPTKEMAYIPLSEGLRIRGKAAADGVGSRLGKSGGAVIQQFLLMMSIGATQITIAPAIAVIFLIGIVIWLYAVVNLNREFVILTEDKCNAGNVNAEGVEEIQGSVRQQEGVSDKLPGAA